MLSNDIRNYRKANYISHGWGKKPEQKEAEKKYNHEYYMKHKGKTGRSKGKKVEDATLGFLGGGLIGAGVSLISDNFKSEEEKKKEQIRNTPCNVLIYNDGNETDGRKRKYIAKVKINGPEGEQYWRYFYTDYQVKCYEDLIKKITDNRDNTSESKYLSGGEEWRNEYDEVDRLLLMYDFKEKEMTPSEDAAIVNPNYDKENSKTSRNCALCTDAYCMRRLGFDVQAVEMRSDTNDEAISVTEWRTKDEIKSDSFYKDLFPDNPTVSDLYYRYTNETKNYKEIEDMIRNEPDGSFGGLGMWWEKGGGHSIVWEKNDGIITYRDTQDISRKTHSSLYYYEEYGASAYSYVRLDNQLPEADQVKRHVKSVKDPYKETVKDDEKWVNEYYRKRGPIDQFVWENFDD